MHTLKIFFERYHLHNERNQVVIIHDSQGTMSSGRTYRKKYRERNSIQRIEVSWRGKSVQEEYTRERGYETHN